MLRPTPEDLETRPIINRAPDTHPDRVPLSLARQGPGGLVPDTETPTQWTPFGVYQPRPHFGGYDELSLRGHGIMHVPQADMYDASPNPFPGNGQFDKPNAIGLVSHAILRLKPTTSAHPGFSMSTKRGDPTSLFRTPPIFGIQTKPIPAVGV